MCSDARDACENHWSDSRGGSCGKNRVAPSCGVRRMVPTLSGIGYSQVPSPVTDSILQVLGWVMKKKL
jgi:hypothetical protein